MSIVGNFVEDFNSKVGINLRAMREARNFKIAEVSRIAGINRTVLDNIELGKDSLNYENLYILSKFYGTSMKNIVEIEYENLKVSEKKKISDEERERELLKARLRLLTNEEKKFVKMVLEQLRKLDGNEEETE